MEQVLKEIRMERYRQDEKWGGASHDDTHTMADWIRFIQQKISLIRASVDGGYQRQKFVVIAALCAAAIQACDRKYGKEGA